MNQAGLAVDDITVLADGIAIVDDDVETLGSDWVAEGFVRHANVLPQEWFVQLVTYPEDGDVTVTRLLSGDATSGSWTIPLSNDVPSAVIVVSALASVTTEPAVYEYTLSAEP